MLADAGIRELYVAGVRACAVPLSCDPSGGSSWSGSLSTLGAINAGASKVVRRSEERRVGKECSSLPKPDPHSEQSPTDPTASNDTSLLVTTTVSLEADLADSQRCP